MNDCIIGLDVSKEKIDCSILSNNHFHNMMIENNLLGYQQLLDYLNNWQCNHVHVCCEATNVYYLGLANYLYYQGYAISVVNPLVIKRYAQYHLKRVKTDKQDAKLIAMYCQQERPAQWQPCSPNQAAIKSLYQRTEQLTMMMTAEKNRLQVADDYSRCSVVRIIELLQTEIDQCRKQIQAIIDADETLQRQQKILQSITGIGKNTAQILLAVMMDIDKFPTAKHLISYLGLSPMIYQSGNYQGRQRLSKMGNKLLRKSLYMPARAACTRSKLWRGWFDAQIAKGKHPKQVYVKMMCKLVRYAYTCIKNNTMFDVTKHQ